MDVYLSDYIHFAEGNDCTLAVLEAIKVLKANPCSCLHLGGGEYHFYGKNAYKKEYYISNNDFSEKAIIFPLMEMENITIDGEGADLMFHGEVVPFVMDKSKNITLKNFKVDYPNPYFFQADITAAAEDFIEIEFDESQFHAKMENGNIVFFNDEDGWSNEHDRLLTCEFESSTSAPSATISPYFIYFPEESDGWFLDSMYRYLKGTQLKSNKIRLDGHFKHTHTVGNKLIATCGPGRRCPGIFAENSENIEISDVTLHSTASMGVICQMCNNVTLNGVKAIPRKGSGRLLSVNADATHFVNCYGKVTLKDCVFTNMLDDALNVHGNYLKVKEKVNEKTLLLEFGHFQQEGVNIFSSGDKVQFFNGLKLTVIADNTVKNSTLISNKELKLELENEVGELPQNTVVHNYTKMPEICVEGTVSGYNRPRGFLLSSHKKTVIKNNTFFNMNQAICFTGDGNDWFESGPVKDVEITGNHFKNSAYAGGFPISSAPHVLEGNLPFHSGIRIENNLFEMFDKRFLRLSYTENLIFKNNTYRHNPEFSNLGDQGENGIAIFDGCENLLIELPKEE